MSMFTWFYQSLEILRYEPEYCLSFFLGKRYTETIAARPCGPKYKGKFFGILRFLRNSVLKISRISTARCLKSSKKYIVYVGTSNQADALEGLIAELNANSADFLVLSEAGIRVSAPNNSHVTLPICPSDVIKSFLVMVFRIRPLVKGLEENSQGDAKKLYFAEFCAAYLYLPLFIKIIGIVKPQYVISANDHSAPNRCLFAVAQRLGVATAYLQHASVSDIFPPLTMNYAFLDGRASLDTYDRCHANRGKSTITRNQSNTRIFLTGNQKNLVVYDRISHDSYVGYAINLLDRQEDVIDVIRFIAEKCVKVKVRPHPAQKITDLFAVDREISRYEHISFCYPKYESLHSFLQGCIALIAGDSSIHLEAAILGVLPIYYRTTVSELYDYYGYVAADVAIAADRQDELAGFLVPDFIEQFGGSDVHGIKYFSETFATKWQGWEPALVAGILKGETDGHQFEVIR